MKSSRYRENKETHHQFISLNLETGLVGAMFLQNPPLTLYFKSQQIITFLNAVLKKSCITEAQYIPMDP